MPRKQRAMPVIGPAFDVCRMSLEDRPESYASELEYYRPAGFSKLAREGYVIARALRANKPDTMERMVDFCDETESLLTEWSRRVTRNPYIVFGTFPDSGDVGFYIDTESAECDADIRLDAGETVPRGFSGLAVFVTDHGNVSARTYSRGRMCRELFDVV